MGKNRLEAFSDGVIAIIITIMVLELKVPHGADWESLFHLWPVFVSYVLSFIYLGIYWNNHHHLIHTAKKVSGGILWANLHLLFWLSLIPFATNWLGEHFLEPLPLAAYSFTLFAAGFAYFLLTKVLIKSHGKDSLLAQAVGKDVKGTVSVVMYLAAIALAFVVPWAAYALNIAVAIIWLIPDRRIEKLLKAQEQA